jgi:hypothetical protein
MPLARQQGINMHPSTPGWKECAFKYKAHVRKNLVLAATGVKLQVKLPDGFPETGPEDVIRWAFSSSSTLSSPNIVIFVAALLGIN